MVLFKGACAASLDEKGRLAIPKRYRDHLPLEPQLTLTASPDNCLLLYLTPAWEKVAAQLQDMPSFNDKARHWKRMIVGHADEVTIDKNDRLQISSSMRTLAKLDKLAWLVGQGLHIEIWDLATYQAHLEQLRTNPPKEDPVGAERFSL